MSNTGIGYQKPPLSSRFKPGNRAYLNRRKKEPSPEATAYTAIMSRSIPVRKGSRTLYKPRMQVLIDNLTTSAVKGDVTAADNLMILYNKFDQPGPFRSFIFYMTPDDENLL